jgi:hypothetical protein
MMQVRKLPFFFLNGTKMVTTGSTTFSRINGAVFQTCGSNLSYVGVMTIESFTGSTEIYNIKAGNLVSLLGALSASASKEIFIGEATICGTA